MNRERQERERWDEQNGNRGQLKSAIDRAIERSMKRSERQIDPESGSRWRDQMGKSNRWIIWVNQMGESKRVDLLNADEPDEEANLLYWWPPGRVERRWLAGRRAELPFGRRSFRWSSRSLCDHEVGGSTRIAGCGLQIDGGGLWTIGRGMWTAGGRLWITDRELPAADCTNCGLQMWNSLFKFQKKDDDSLESSGLNAVRGSWESRWTQNTKRQAADRNAIDSVTEFLSNSSTGRTHWLTAPNPPLAF